MTGKAARVTLWPSACQVLGAMLDSYEAMGHCCFEEDDCEYATDCDHKRASNCKFAKQFQLVKARLFRGGCP